MLMRRKNNFTHVQMVSDLHSHTANMEALGRRLNMNPDLLWAAIRPNFTGFRKPEYRKAIEELYNSKTGQVLFSAPIERRLEEAADLYARVRFDGDENKKEKAKFAEWIADQWSILAWPEGDYRSAIDPSGMNMLRGSICFAARLAKIDIECLPDEAEETAIEAFANVIQLTDDPSQKMRATISLAGVRQLALKLKGYGDSPISRVLTQDERQTLIPALMARLKVPMPRKVDVINAVMFASSLELEEETLCAAKLLVELDPEFADANYEGWSSLKPVANDPDLAFYRTKIAPWINTKEVV